MLAVRIRSHLSATVFVLHPKSPWPPISPQNPFSALFVLAGWGSILDANLLAGASRLARAVLNASNTVNPAELRPCRKRRAVNGLR